MSLTVRQRHARGVVILLVALGIAIVSQLRAPSWWSPQAFRTAADQSIGERFEQGCVAALSRVREDETPWSIRFTEDELNAWLANRLPAWCDHAGVPPPQHVQVRFLSDRIECAFRLPGRFPVATIPLSPTLVDAQLSPHVGAVRLGRLPVPYLGQSLLSQAIGAISDEETGDLRTQLLPLLRGEPIDAAWELSDGRRVVLQDIEVLEGEIRMECVTLGRSTKR